MKKLITMYEFIDEMKEFNKYSRRGLEVLFEYLDEMEDYIFDPIGITLDFTEYENIEEYNEDYGTEYKNYSEIIETIILPIGENSFIALNY